MDFPESLPLFLEYRCPTKLGPIVIITLPRNPVSYVGTSGKHTAPIVHPMIPEHADAWKLPMETEWKPLKELPEDWLPFLRRARPSVMDPRKPLEEELKKHRFKDAIRDDVEGTEE